MASILSSLLVGSPPAQEEETPAPETAPPAATPPAVDEDIAAIKNELAALRTLIEGMAGNVDKK